MPRQGVAVPGPVPRQSRSRRHRRRRRLVAGLVAVLGLLGAVAWVLLGSSLLDVRSVQVIGARELSAETVREVAAVPLGASMLRLDAAAIEARVAAVGRVAGVQVSRTLGGTVRIVVTERVPVLRWAGPDGVHLVDATGTDYATVPEPPPDLPELRVARVGDSATVAAVTVLDGLPATLRAQVHWVAAASPADVVLGLAENREVHWGGVEAGARKAAVLAPLLTRPGTVYDVSSPDLPTIS